MPLGMGFARQPSAGCHVTNSNRVFPQPARGLNGQIQSCSPHCSSSQETLECSRQAKDLNLLLRRVLHLAIEWGVLESAPKIELLTGERRRERVVTAEEESRYLSAASPLLEAVATVLADTGLRPDECHR